MRAGTAGPRQALHDIRLAGGAARAGTGMPSCPNDRCGTGRCWRSRMVRATGGPGLVLSRLVVPEPVLHFLLGSPTLDPALGAVLAPVERLR